MANYEKQFSTTAVNKGGRDGKSSLEEKDFSVNIVAPGSKREGTNPEELFALGYAACYHSALDAVKKQENVEGDSLVKPKVTLYQVPDSADFKIGIELEVSIEGQDVDAVQKLAEEAHNVCPYSKAIKNGDVELETKAVEYK